MNQFPKQMLFMGISASPMTEVIGDAESIKVIRGFSRALRAEQEIKKALLHSRKTQS